MASYEDYDDLEALKKRRLRWQIIGCGGFLVGQKGAMHEMSHLMSDELVHLATAQCVDPRGKFFCLKLHRPIRLLIGCVKILFDQSQVAQTDVSICHAFVNRQGTLVILAGAVDVIVAKFCTSTADKPECIFWI